jgi:NitT/TauT family transport system ATP-binding protein
MLAIEFHQTTVSFALPQGTYEAVDQSSFTIAPGEFVSLVGPTGCGKSTLLNVAAGLLKPASGSVSIYGETLKDLNTKAGYLFQQDSLFPWKTARDNVAIALEIAGVEREEALSKAQEWLTRVGLKAFGDRYPHHLSGGQRKRVALAQVLIRNPQILLMDEPFGPLDAQTRLIMGDLLLKLWQEDKKAVLFVTHDLEEAIALSDRVLVMSTGPKAKIIGDYKIPLARPRDLTEVKIDPAFHEVQRLIWNKLKAEVLKTYGDEA